MSASQPEVRRLSRLPRQIGRGLVLLVWTWLLLEAAAWGLLWVRIDAAPSWGRLRALGEAVRLTALGETPTGDPGAGGPFSVPHPYVGFVPGSVRRDPRARVSGLCDAPLGDPTSPFFDEDEFVVAIGGGSFAAGIANNEWERLRERLRALPEVGGRDPLLLKLAIPGQKQPQQLEALAYVLALGVEPDLVVQIDGFNEIALHGRRNARLGVFAAYPSNWLPVHAGRADPVALGTLVAMQRRRLESAQEALTSPLRWSFLYQAWWHERDRRFARRADAALERVEAAAREVARERPALLGPPTRDEDEETTRERLVTLWRRSALAMHALCASRGAVFLHVLQPNQYVPGTKTLSEEERAVAWREDSPYREPVERGYPLLREAGAELAAAGVRFVDATGLFRDVAEAVYVDDCCHLNGLGQRLFTDALADWIAAALE